MKRRHEFIWIVRNAYEDLKTMKSPVAVMLSVGFSAVLVWFFLALEPVLTLVNQWFAHRVLAGPPPSPEKGTFGGAVRLVVLPSLLLIGLFTGLYFRYRKPRPSKVYANMVSPEPHEGLIFLLSPYKPRRDVSIELDVPQDVEALYTLLNREDEGAWANLRQQIFATNWGTLYAAVQHHRDTLQHCWLVSTEGPEGSKAQVKVAERLVQVAALRSVPVSCHYEDYSVADAHDISKIVPVIDWIYVKALPVLELDEDQVIADITGGTAAMSAAMALVTIDRERKIEYLRQDKPLLIQKEGFRARSPDEIRDEPVLMMVETWRDLAPRRANKS